MSDTTLYNLVVTAVSGAPGTGDITLGAPVAPYLGFSNYPTTIADGTVVSYSMIDGSSNSEIGHATYRTPAASSTTYGKLTGRTVEASTNSDSTITASSAAIVRCSPTASDLVLATKGYTWTAPQIYSSSGESFDLIGQGAPTTVSILVQPDSPAAGRAYALAGQIEGDGESGQKVGVYGAAECSGSGADDIWGGNFLAQWASSNDVNVQSVEIDMNNNQSDTFSNLKTGLSVNSGGTYHGGHAVLINSTSVDNAWKTAILIPAAGALAGIAIGDPTSITGDISVRQLNNGDDTILLQRNTDSGMSGQLLRAVNEANSENILIIDVQGNVTTKGIPLFLNDFSIPAGGVTGTGFLMSATANFGTFFGSGAPTLSAAQGSLYLRSDGNSTSTRAYINTNGSTGWTALMTAA